MSDNEADARFGAWIGRQNETRDILTERIDGQFRASLEPYLAASAAAPALIHWCLGVGAVPEAGIGPDGHPLTGEFLPPIPLPRRMWAAGALTFHDDLRIGDEVRRLSTIRSVARKAGRTGDLWFVDIGHAVSTPRGLAIEETQTLVYREATVSAAPPATTPATAAVDGKLLDFSAGRLFRYSAITFNGHRIHYDLPYARDVEGYPGLVVHGPLQATILAHAAMARRGSALATFHFRGTSALIGPCQATITFAETNDGLRLSILDRQGRVTMEGQATFRSGLVANRTETLPGA